MWREQKKRATKPSATVTSGREGWMWRKRRGEGIIKAFAYQKIFKFPGTLQLQWALGLDALPVWVSVFLLCEMWLILHRAAHEFQKTGNLFLTVSCYVAGFQYTVARKVTSKSHETLSQGPSTPILLGGSYRCAQATLKSRKQSGYVTALMTPMV